MNLSILFEMQKVLDDRIEREHPPVPGEDRLAKKILSLQVEIGELANEWRGFKFWSKDQQPRTCSRKAVVSDDQAKHPIQFADYNPLLEEYVDCLHFILSIGLEIGFKEPEISWFYKSNDTTQRFLKVNYQVAVFSLDQDLYEYQDMFAQFLSLAEPLGFTWDQVESAYIAKNQVNHERQANGY